MKKIILLTLSILLLPVIIAISMRFIKKKNIEKAVDFQMTLHPKSTLMDIYKSFFQDHFGPEHMIPDPSEAKKNLLSEIASATSFKGLLLEPTGFKHRYYRVNLFLLHDARIPVDTFMSVFLESSETVNWSKINNWYREWKFIEKVIEKMNLDIQGSDKDLEYINQLLLKGQYVVHHSETFIKEYDPHYRIISKKLFDRKLKRFIYRSD